MQKQSREVVCNELFRLVLGAALLPKFLASFAFAQNAIATRKFLRILDLSVSRSRHFEIFETRVRTQAQRPLVHQAGAPGL